MLRITDYLLQAQVNISCYDQVNMIKVDTRGSGSALSSLWPLTKVVAKITSTHMRGRLAGVHVNMAERLSVFRKGIVVTVCRLIGVPTVLHLHAAQMESYYGSLSGFSKFLIRKVFLLANRVIVLGENSRNFVVTEMGISAQKVEVVINGVPAPRVARRVKADIVRRKILFLGNLWERKGISDFINAIAALQLDPAHFEVSVAGGGDIRHYIEMVEKLRLTDLITFSGWVDQASVAKLLAEADVMVLPSYDEGLPLVILEALANGVAVICTPVGEIPHVLTDQVNVVFVTPGDVGGISAALHEVMANDELQSRLESNGRKVYEEKFSLEKFSRKVAAIHIATFNLGEVDGTETQPAGRAERR